MDIAQSMALGSAHSLTEGARRATGVSECVANAATGAVRPEPEVREKQTYRRLTAEYKLRILREADACGSGENGALLRREGLYSSHLTRWRKQREAGVLDALASRKRGRRAVAEAPLRKQLAKLERENDRLKKRLKQAEAIIDVQKKVSEMLGIGMELGEGVWRSE